MCIWSVIVPELQLDCKIMICFRSKIYGFVRQQQQVVVVVWAAAAAAAVVVVVKG